MVVRPNERLPADGFVSEGASAINQAPVTGESVPVDKSAVSDIASARKTPDRLADTHRVFAGTINGSGALEVVVTRRSSETTLSKVVQMVSAAEAQQSPTQRFTQRFARIFVGGAGQETVGNLSTGQPGTCTQINSIYLEAAQPFTLPHAVRRADRPVRRRRARRPMQSGL